MEALLQLKYALWHNVNYVIETSFVWILVAFTHVLGMTPAQPVVIDILPYVQLVSLLLASAASGFTIYKIRKDLRRK